MIIKPLSEFKVVSLKNWDTKTFDNVVIWWEKGNAIDGFWYKADIYADINTCQYGVLGDTIEEAVKYAYLWLYYAYNDNDDDSSFCGFYDEYKAIYKETMQWKMIT